MQVPRKACPGTCKRLVLKRIMNASEARFRWGMRCKFSVKTRAARPGACRSKRNGRYLSNIFVKVLQILAHGDHELIGVSAVNNAVIVTHGKPDDMSHGNR